MNSSRLHALQLGVSLGIITAAGSAMAGPLVLAPPSHYGDRQQVQQVQYQQPAQYQQQAYYRPAPEQRPAYAQPQQQMGGGFLEFLFSGGQANRQQPLIGPAPQQPQYQYGGQQQVDQYGRPMQAGLQPSYQSEPARPGLDPRFEKQMVRYDSGEKAGTIVIDTRSKFLYLVQGNGTALRYGVGVGRPEFLWVGTKHVTRKREWPDWTPPPEMLVRRPDLPRHMEGGPENPLGARAMYLGSSLYRIHGSNEPWTIGTNVSSGCIRMRNEDVVDLYERVKVGTKVVVL
jgi:lipoprotein-anchoring transpeptidase ErfK/SrfK